MIEVLLGVALVQLWLLWRIRRALGLRGRPRFIRTPRAREGHRAEFRGAIPPNRFCVVRWPDGLLLYNGCVGALARRTYEYTHPEEGQEIEFWELENCRGHK